MVNADEVKAHFRNLLTSMMLDRPLYALLVKRLRVVYMPDDEKLVAEVTEREIRLGRNFFERSHADQRFIISHEALHLILSHTERAKKILERLGANLHRALNAVADAKINHALKSDGFPPPADALMPDDVAEHLGLKEEEILRESLEEIALKLKRAPPAVSPLMLVDLLIGNAAVGDKIEADATGKGDDGGGEAGGERGEGEGRQGNRQEKEAGGKEEGEQEVGGKQGEAGGGQGGEDGEDGGDGGEEAGGEPEAKEGEGSAGDGSESDGEEAGEEGEGGRDATEGGVVLNEGDREIEEAGSVEELKAAKSRVLMEVVYAAKAVGIAPAGLERLIEELEKPRMNWRRLLRMVLKRGLGNDVRKTWSRPNRKNPMLPFKEPFGVKSVIVLVDTSGSIGEEQLKQMVGEIYAIARLRAKVVVIPWDAEVYDPIFVRSPSDIYKVRAGLKGGGGTVITPAVEKALQLSKRGDVFVILSDFYTAESDSELVELVRKLKRRGEVVAVSVDGYDISFLPCIKARIRTL